ncbi:hypothetical protein VPH35_000298 [Triticum aestivum]
MAPREGGPGRACAVAQRSTTGQDSPSPYSQQADHGRRKPTTVPTPELGGGGGGGRATSGGRHWSLASPGIGGFRAAVAGTTSRLCAERAQRAIHMASPSDMPKEPPAATIQVQVQWCGTDYPVGVKADADIGELKRKACEVTGLPSKRQKHMNPKNKEYNDDHPIGLLQPPHMTDLISLNNKVAHDIYKDHFFGEKPTCSVKATKDRIVDFDGSRTKLYKGKYQVGSMEIQCLIKF